MAQALLRTLWLLCGVLLAAPLACKPTGDKSAATLVLEHEGSRDIATVCTDLGAAQPYNVFVTGAYSGSGSDIQGAMAAGGSVTLASYDIGQSLSTSGGTPLALVVGQNLTFASGGGTLHGNVRVGGTWNISPSVTVQGNVQKATPVDFAGTGAHLADLSNTYGALVPNGTATNNYGGMNLTGTDAALNVFQFSQATLASLWGVNINVPSTSFVIVNITGTSPNLHQTITLNGLDTKKVLFNFPQATTLTLQNIQLTGSVLAPNAAVSFNSGAMFGNLLAKSFSGTGQTNFAPLPLCIPIPSLCASVICKAQDSCHGVGTCNANTGTCSNPQLVSSATFSPPASLPALLPGQSTSAVFGVTNSGTGSASSLAIHLTEPDGTTGNATLATLAAGQTANLSVNAIAAALAAKGANETSTAYLARLGSVDQASLSFPYTASASDSCGGAGVSPNGALHASELLPILNLVFSTAATAKAGDTLDYALTVTNSGHAPASPALTLTLPDGTSQAVNAGASIGAGASTTLHVLYPIPATQQTAALTASASLSWQDARGTGYGPISGIASTAVSGPPALALALSAPASGLPGAALSATLSVTNSGTGAATSTSGTAQLPDGTSTTWSTGPLAAGATTTVTVMSSVPAVPVKGASETDASFFTRLQAVDQRSLSWSASGSATSGSVTSAPANSGAVTIEVLPLLHLSLSTAATAKAGETLDYSLTLTNTGHASATPALTLTLPNGTTQAVSAGSAIAAGASTTVHVSHAIPATQPTATLTASANLSWVDARGTSYEPVSASASTAVSGPPALTLALSAPASGLPGAALSATLSATNSGTGAATSTTGTAQLPNGTSTTWSTGALPAGATTSVTLSSAVPAASAKGAAETDASYLTRLQALDHRALAWSASGTATSGSVTGPLASASAATIEVLPVLAVDPPAALTLVARQSASVTFTVRNSGSAAAPASSLVLATGAPVAVASIAAGASTIVQVTATAPDAPDGASSSLPYLWTWTDAQSGTYGPLGGQIGISVIRPAAQLGLSAPADVLPGSAVGLIAVLANVGHAAALPGAVRFSLPDGAQASVNTPQVSPGASAQVTAMWPVPLPAPRQFGEPTASYRARLAAFDRQTLASAASASYMDAAGNAYQAGPSTATTLEHLPVVALDAPAPADALPGEPQSLVFTARDTGSAVAKGVAVSAAMPDGRSLLAASVDVVPGASAPLTLSWTLPGATRSQAETDASYRARLAKLDGAALIVSAAVAWLDANGNAYGRDGLTASIAGYDDAVAVLDEVAPIVDVTLTAPAQARSGDTIHATLSLQNAGHASAGHLAPIVTLPDGTTQVPSLSASALNPGETTTADIAYSIPSSQPGGPISFQVQLAWQDVRGSAYGPLGASATVEVKQANLPPVVSAGPDQTVSLPSISQAPDFVPAPAASGLVGAGGAGFHAPSGQMLVSVNAPSGEPHNFDLVAADGSRARFSTVHGVTGDVDLAVAPDDGGGTSSGGFLAGTVFAAGSPSGVLLRISADGQSAQQPWVTLPGETGAVNGGLSFDQSGAFGGDLLVATTSGAVWRVTAAGAATKVAQVDRVLAGLTSVPADSPRYGAWAGKILASVQQPIVPPAIDPTVNGGFESGLTGWSTTGSAAVVATARGGASSLQLGLPTATQVSTASQQLHVPASGGILSFWYQNVCLDSVHYDWASATVTDATTHVVTVILPMTCRRMTAWEQVTADLSQSAGHDITLTLTNVDDLYPGDPTYTLIDDVSLTPASGGAPPAPSETLLAIDAQGAAVAFDLGIRGAASIALVPNAASFFGVDPGAGLLYSAPTAQLFPLAGDLLVAGRAHGEIWRVRAGGGALQVNRVTQATSWRGVAFAPAALPVAAAVTATLAGSASDDGLPNPPGQLTLSWSGISGPGPLTFANATQAVTAATLTLPGTYLLQLTASDSVLTSSSQTHATVLTANKAPLVNAGPDQLVTLPASATLAGLATDDGLPVSSTLSYSWTAVSGPGSVAFDSPSSIATHATFSAPGEYLLQFAASDGELTGHSRLLVVASRPPGMVLVLSAPATVQPNNYLVYTVTATNTGSTDMAATLGVLTFAIGDTASFNVGALAAGASAQATISWWLGMNTSRVFSGYGYSEDQAAYLARLHAADGTVYSASAAVDWTDVGGTTGNVQAQASTTLKLPIVESTAVLDPNSFVPNQPVTLLMTLTNTGHADAIAVSFSNWRFFAQPDLVSLAPGETATVAAQAAAPFDDFMGTGRALDLRTTFLEVQTTWRDTSLSASGYGLTNTTATGTDIVPNLALSVSAPLSWLPSESVPLSLGVSNTGHSRASDIAVFGDGLSGSDTVASLQPGEATALAPRSWQASSLWTRGAYGSDASYLDSLVQQVLRPASNISVNASWHDDVSGTYSGSADTSGQLVLPVVTAAVAAAAPVYLGAQVPVTFALQSTGSATAVAVVAQLERGIQNRVGPAIDPGVAPAVFAQLAPGSVAAGTLLMTAPDGHQPFFDERGSAYVQRLYALSYTTLLAGPMLSWQDALPDLPNQYGPTTTLTTIPLLVPVVDFAFVGSTAGFPGATSPLGFLNAWSYGSAPAVTATVTIRFGSAESSSPLADRPLQHEYLSNVPMTWTVPSIPPRGTQSTVDYLAQLFSARAAQPGTLEVTWTDGRGTVFGPVAQAIRQRRSVPVVTVEDNGPTALLPGAALPIVLRNDGDWAPSAILHAVPLAGSVDLFVDGGSYYSQFAGGARRIVQVEGAAPAAAARAIFSSDDAYAASLASLDGQVLQVPWSLDWTAEKGQSFGTTVGSAALNVVLPRYRLDVVADPFVSPGTATHYAVTVTNVGSAAAASLTVSVALTGEEAQILTLSSGLSAPGGKQSFQFTKFINAKSGQVDALVTASWSDARGTGYGPLSASAHTQINAAPVVDAGPDRPAVLAAGADLHGSVSDDGLPTGSVLASTWSQLSGLGWVKFADPSQPRTHADFTETGTYLLQLSASDGVLSSAAVVRITVNATARANQPPVVNAGPDQSVPLRGTSADQVPFELEVVAANLPTVIGLDDHPTSHSVLASVNYPSGEPHNFELIHADGTHEPFSSVHGLTDEVYFVTVRDDTGTGQNVGGFTAGEVFAGTGVPGEIIRIAADGSSSQRSWATLPGEDGLLRGGFTFDNSVYGGDLIVSSDTGGIWRVNAGGAATLLAHLPRGGFYEGIAVVPDAPKYGPWAGCVLVPGESQNLLWTVDRQGAVRSWDLGIYGPENAHMIPPGQDFYGSDYGSGVIVGAPEAELAPFVGQILISEEFSGNLYRVRWDGSAFQKNKLGQVHQFEGVGFSPTGLVNVPPAGALVKLHGTATDDGLPDPPASLTYQWSQIGGPAQATIQSSATLDTAVVLTEAGTYQFQVTASDSQLSGSSRMTVLVDPPNNPPTVDAGGDQSIFLPASALLNGRASDDGLPSGLLTLSWSKAEGPGDVVFSAPALSSTTASFSAAGVYRLRLTANDGEFSRTSDLLVSVRPYDEAPLVDAGPPLTVSWPAREVPLHGSASGYLGRPLTTTWRALFTLAPVAFMDAGALNTTASFGQPGEYELQLVASDGILTTIGVTHVSVVDTGGPNQPPHVDAGLDQRVVLPQLSTTLQGTVTDDQKPVGAQLAVSWSLLGGPGSASFATPSAAVTQVTFDSAGIYQLQLTANDTQYSASSTVTVDVVRAGATGPGGIYVSGVAADAQAAANLPGAIHQLQVAVAYTSMAKPSPAILLVSDPRDPKGEGADARLGLEAAGFTQFDSATAAPLDQFAGWLDVNTVDFMRYDVVLVASDYGWLRQVEVDVLQSRSAALLEFVNAGGGLVAFSESGSRPIPPGTDSGVTSGRFGFLPLDLGPQVVEIVDLSYQSAFVTVAGQMAGLRFYDFMVTPSGVHDVFTHSAGLDQLASLAGGTPIVLAGRGRSYSLEGAVNQAPAVTASTASQLVLPQALALQGTAMDDGLPAGSTLSLIWSKLLGPGPVSFADAGAASTSATFSTAGRYVLRLSASDSLLTTSVDLAVNVLPQDTPPVMDAGPNQTLTLPQDEIQLRGSATRDPVLVGGSLSLAWSVDSGPGAVAFGSPQSAWTTARFGAPGVYVLRLTADDSLLSAFAQTTVTVLGAATANRAPAVDAGLDHAIALPANVVQLVGVVTDDGLPVGGSLSITWSLDSGPGPVAFADPQAAVTSVRFSAPGLYVLRLSASDTLLTSGAITTVTVTGDTSANLAPFVDAGPAQIVQAPVPASGQLHGTVVDDGKPAGGTLTQAWSVIAGPAGSSFDDASISRATFTMTALGSYRLRLTASDTDLTSYAETVVTLQSAPPQTNQAPRVDSGPDQSLTFPINRAILAGSATDDGLPTGSTLVTRWEVRGGAGIVTFADPGAAATNATFSWPGNYLLRLTASDGTLSSYSELVVNVGAPPGTAPTVGLLSPEQGFAATAPLRVTGNISEGIWRLDYTHDADDDAPHTWQTLATGTGPVGGLLGTFDTTRLLNGIYELRLTATTEGGDAEDTRVLSVEKNLKVGNFAVAFTDAVVPLPGLPMTVVRSYDSRDDRVGDFGRGWQLSVSDVRLEKSAVVGKFWQETLEGGFAFPSYCYSVDERHPNFVTITFPTGKVYKFIVDIDVGGAVKAGGGTHCQRFSPSSTVDVVYSPEPGTVGQLSPLSSQTTVEIQTLEGQEAQPGPVQLMEMGSSAGDAITTVYNPKDFVLTIEDGTRYVVRQGVGVLSIIDTHGNELDFARDGVSSGRYGTRLGIIRDADGRISQISDPSGKSLLYAYDVSGNLATFTDRDGHTTQFAYDALNRLLSITDAVGVTVMANTWNGDGRLGNTADASGTPLMTYQHDLDGHREIVKDREGNSVTYEYDEDGNVVHKVDALGKETFATFDANDNRLTETDALGHKTTRTFDAESNKLSETDALGNTTWWTYDGFGKVLTTQDPRGNLTINGREETPKCGLAMASGDLLSTTDALGDTTTYSYGCTGLLSSQTDARGTTSYAYDGAGHLLSTTDALGNSTAYSYDDNGNQLTETRTRTLNAAAETVTTAYEYDSSGRRTKVTYADGTSTLTSYNALGKAEHTTDQLSRLTSYAYDDQGRLTTTSYPDGTASATTYDDLGRRKTSTDRAGRTTSYGYDAAGRLTTTTYPDGTSRTIIYDDAGRVRESHDELSRSTSYGYDAAGRRTTVTDPLGNVTSFAYDAAGNQLSVTDANSNTVSYVYDQLNRQTSTVYPDATHDATEYDAQGNRSARVDQAGIRTEYGYDALGRLVGVVNKNIDGNGTDIATSYSYDELGNRLAQTDANNHTTSFAYDDLGRRTSRTLPLGETEHFTYYDDSQLKTRKDFNGHTTTYAYEPTTGRLATRTPDAFFTSEQPVSWTYYTSGRRHTMSDATGVTSYTYDSRDRLLQKVTPEGTLTYTYDVAGNRSTVRSDSGAYAVDYGYDSLNRLHTVTDRNAAAGTNGLVTMYHYDAGGRLGSYDYPNGVTTTMGYDSLNRVQNVTLATAWTTPTTLASYAYTFYAAGNRHTVAELSGRSVTWGYDNLWRLTGETIAGSASAGTVGYTYDAVGNRLTRSSTVPGLSAQASTYDADDRLNADGYDSVGNTVASSGNAYGYDSENRLLSLNTTAAGYLYDGDGQLVSKTAAGTTTTYLIDDQTPAGYTQIAEERVGGVVAKSYVFGPQRISLRAGGAVHYYGYDTHSGVRVLLDDSGAVTDTYEYDAFGSLVGSTGSTANSFTYRGEQTDSTLGLQYLRARWMDPAKGRFGIRDTFEGRPVDPRSITGYSYAAGDPILYADEAGQDFGISEVAATIAVIGVLSDLSDHGPFNLQKSPRPGCQCTVEVRTTFIGGISVREHAYVVLTDPSGHGEAWRGGPEGFERPGAPYGWITAQHGDYTSSFIDWDPSGPSVVIDANPATPCSTYHTKWMTTYIDIINAHVPYKPFGPNSNSVAYQFLLSAGLPTPSIPSFPLPFLPGWGEKVLP